MEATQYTQTWLSPCLLIVCDGESSTDLRDRVVYEEYKAWHEKSFERSTGIHKQANYQVYYLPG